MGRIHSSWLSVVVVKVVKVRKVRYGVEARVRDGRKVQGDLVAAGFESVVVDVGVESLA